ncbi:MAG: shikimate dehydrogenase [Chitinophagales bacterium]|nr:shikimate dehydrogenase [Chitinophagales bacterium]
MKLFGLIGYPLTHSFSKKYFTDKFSNEHIDDCVYENFPLLKVEDFSDLITSHPKLAGLNVTIPYKESIIQNVHELDPVAKEIAAVNTIKFAGGILKGYNTDVYGFMQSFAKELGDGHKQALILGTGGSSKAVAYSLKKLGIFYKYVSRDAEKNDVITYEDITPALMNESKIIINTTPLGMFPHIGSCPMIPYERLTASHFLFDLIYNPEETLFLKKGREAHAKTKNGLEMLKLQAEKSWEIWNG